MLKVTVFLCLSLSLAKTSDENIPQLRHHRELLRKFGLGGSPWSKIPPHDEHRKQWVTYDNDKMSDVRSIFNLLGEDDDREELSTPAPESEVFSYGDDAKNYKVGLPLPQKPKEGEAASLMCYVPTRRGMIVTHCGLADDEGTCPTTKSCGFVIPHFWSLPKLCLSDFDCPYEQKCCSHSCYQHKVCQHPIPENTEATVNHINIKQFINLNINKETPEFIESLLNATLNGTDIDESLWNLTTSNSSDYNLTVSYSHDIGHNIPLNLTAANSSNELDIGGTREPISNELNTSITNGSATIISSNELNTSSTSEPATTSSSNELGQTFNLTVSNSTQEYSLPENLTHSGKEYETISNNLTFNSSNLPLFHVLPKANPFDPDAELDEIEDFNGSGSGDDSIN